MSVLTFANLLDGTKMLWTKAQGVVAHDAVASGNPVQVGGVYRATDPNVADGDIASLRVNAKGEALVSLSGRKLAVRVINLSETSDVVAGGYKDYTILPTSGYIARLLNIFSFTPATIGGSAGNHSVSVYDSAGVAMYLRASSAYNVNVNINGCDSSVSTLTPPDKAAFTMALSRPRFTATSPLIVRYNNDSTGGTSASRAIRLVVEEEAII